MRVYRYFPPSPEEQRSFFILVAGSALAVLVAVVLIFFVTKDAGPRALLTGACLAILWRLAQSSWELEKRGQRARNAQIGVGDEGLELVDSQGKQQSVAWKDIEEANTIGGRLHLRWKDGSLMVGAREVENGMIMTQEILRRLSKPEKTSNFIPLEPK